MCGADWGWRWRRAEGEDCLRPGSGLVKPGVGLRTAAPGAGGGGNATQWNTFDLFDNFPHGGPKQKCAPSPTPVK